MACYFKSRIIPCTFCYVFWLLSGDVAINPGPCNVHVNRSVKCLAMNARSLMSTHKLTESETVCNLNCFQDLVYSEQIDIVCVNETAWLNGNIDNSEILNSDYTDTSKRSPNSWWWSITCN